MQRKHWHVALPDVQRLLKWSRKEPGPKVCNKQAQPGGGGREAGLHAPATQVMWVSGHVLFEFIETLVLEVGLPPHSRSQRILSEVHTYTTPLHQASPLVLSP